MKVSPAEYGFDYPDFYTTETEVTNYQYAQFLEETVGVKNDALEALERGAHRTSSY